MTSVDADLRSGRRLESERWSMAFYSYHSLNVGCNGGNGNILSKQKSLFNSNKYDDFVAGLDEDGSFLHCDILWANFQLIIYYCYYVDSFFQIFGSGNFFGKKIGDSYNYHECYLYR